MNTIIQTLMLKPVGNEQLDGEGADDDPDERLTFASILRNRANILVYGITPHSKMCAREETIRQFNSIR